MWTLFIHCIQSCGSCCKERDFGIGCFLVLQIVHSRLCDCTSQDSFFLPLFAWKRFTACLQEMRAFSQISRSLMEHHSGNGSSSAGFFDPGYDKLSKLEFLEAWRALKENHEYHILVDKVASVSESKVIAALHCQNIMGTAVKSLRDRVRARYLHCHYCICI